MGVLKIKKEILAIFIVGLLVATTIGAISVSASLIKKQDELPILPAGFGETGDVGAFVFYDQFGKTDKEPRIVPITDATVYCKDINGVTHEMFYEEIEPGFYAFVASEVPVGECQITASKDGYSTETINAIVFGGFDIYLIELDQTPISRFGFIPLFERLLQRFQRFSQLLKI